MSEQLAVLLATAASLGFIHTLLGPDHYLPFVAMSRVGNWSEKKTFVVTFLCGLGHVLSSVVLGFVGVALGIAVFRLEAVESWRGDLAGWLLLAFGLCYTAWGIKHAAQNRPHEHFHAHYEGDCHVHEHRHVEEHSHVHENKSAAMTPWILFTVFVFGPCEPLIPLLIYPAAQGSLFEVALVATVFGVVTISTMLVVVHASCYGLKKIAWEGTARYSHALAGSTILLCGLAIQFLGL